MILATFNFDADKSSVVIVVIGPQNLGRMKLADPITLESLKKGGMLDVKYGANVSMLIAYEEDEMKVQELAQRGTLDLLQYLERGRKFIKGVDGKENSIPIVGKSVGEVH